MVWRDSVPCKTRRNIFFGSFKSVGNVESELTLNNDCIPRSLDLDETTGGYVISNKNGCASVSAAGDCQILVDYSEDEDNVDVFGVLSLPSGDILASRGNELIKVTPTGAVESVVTWNAEPAIDGAPNPDFELFVWSIARNLVTNEIGLFGFFGGFATWHETTGLVLHRTVDVENWDGRHAYAGSAKDGGGWFSLLYTSETQEICRQLMKRFRLADSDHLRKQPIRATVCYSTRNHR